MKKKRVKSLFAFIICMIITAVSILAASYIESDFGKVGVKQIRIPITTNNGISTYITAKLYIPDGVNSSNPAPAVLCMHGYQNDKDIHTRHLRLSLHGVKSSRCRLTSLVTVRIRLE